MLITLLAFLILAIISGRYRNCLKKYTYVFHFDFVEGIKLYEKRQ